MSCLFQRLHLFAVLLLGPASAVCGTETVTNAHELFSIQRESQNGVPFEITGQVVVPPYWRNLPFSVEINGRCVIFYSRLETFSGYCSAGDLIRISGVTSPSDIGGVTNLDCTDLQVLSRGTLRKIPVKSIADYLAGDFVNRRVSLRGTLTDILPDDIDARFFHLTLTDGDKTAYLVFQGKTSDLVALQKQRGRDVVATGVGYWNFGDRTFAKSKPLLISWTNAIHVAEEEATHDPFDAPEVTTLGGSRQPMPEFGKVHKLRGVVTARWNGDSFLLRLANGKTARVELIDGCLPLLGETVEAVGHLETDLIDLYLLRAVWRESERMALPAPPTVTTSIRDLFTNNSGTGSIPSDSQGRTFRIRGTIKNISTDQRGFHNILLTDDEHAILVNCSCASKVLNVVTENCVVNITGVCIKESDFWRPNIDLPRIRGTFLVLNRPEDVVVIATPPWWTPARFVIALTILLGIIIAILIWNVTLRRLVTRKSRALLREQAAKLEETLKIDERTRLAAELHDYLAQNLTVISYQVSAAESALATNNAEAADCLKTADRMLLSCRTDLRRCLWDLKSDALNEPDFTKAVERTAEPVSGDANLHVRFAVSRSRLSDSTAHAVLSICRELVSNAVRHGKADKVQIAGELKDETLRFSVRDNGRGFDPATRPGQTDGHFGLDGVAERIRRFNGQLQIDSTPGKGTRIVVTLRPKDSPT